MAADVVGHGGAPATVEIVVEPDGRPVLLRATHDTWSAEVRFTNADVPPIAEPQAWVPHVSKEGHFSIALPPGMAIKEDKGSFSGVLPDGGMLYVYIAPTAGVTLKVWTAAGVADYRKIWNTEPESGKTIQVGPDESPVDTMVSTWTVKIEGTAYRMYNAALVSGKAGIDVQVFVDPADATGGWLDLLQILGTFRRTK